MRISDWSSDVCSSDLILPSRLREGLGEGMFVGWVAVTGPPQTPPASGRGLTRLARLISCNAPRTAPFTTPKCVCPLQLPSREQPWRPSATQAVGAIERKSGVEGESVEDRVDLGGLRIIKKNKYLQQRVRSRMYKTGV